MSSLKRLRMTSETKDICATQCQAQCCQNKFVMLTQEEGERLSPLSPKIVKGTNQEYMMMFLRSQCDFLSEEYTCTIYASRPAGCAAFPYKPMAYCLLWPEKELV